MTETNALRVSDLDVYYRDFHALWSVSLDVKNGEIVSVIGANGSGKSTLLNTIAGLQVPGKGSIEFFGRSIQGHPAYRVVDMGISLVPEGRRVFKHLTVDENIRAGSITRKDGAQAIRDDHRKMYEHFPRLAKITHRLAGYCSGGEQQMIAIARALMAAPQMLMLDEPSLGLAPLLVKEIFENIETINQELDTTILVVEQNAKIALQVSDYAYIMESGKIVLEGPSDGLRDNPDVKEFYMGITQGGGRKSFKEVKSYKRRKRWM